MRKKLFDTEVLRELKKKEKIYVGFSGGSDSVCLLHFMKFKLHLNNLIAVHVNHGINSQSNEWEQICKKYAESFQVNFVSYRIDRKISKNLEFEARKFRMNFFASISDHIVLAHHMNDNVENFFISLLRSRKPENYKIKNKSVIETDNGKILEIYHPILKVTKEQILSYCKENNLSYIEDPSNYDIEKYDRNWFRFFIKKANARFPCFSKKIIHALKSIDELNELAEELAKEDLIKYLKEDNIIETKELIDNGISSTRFKNMVVFLCKKRNYRITKKDMIFIDRIYNRKGKFNFDEFIQNDQS